MTIWIDGNWKDKENATVSVFDHGLLYGDGIFEGMRIYRGRIFRLNAHLLRFFDGARVLMLDTGLTMDQLALLLEEVCQRNGSDTGYVRMVLTRGTGPLGLDPSTCDKSSLIIIADTIRLYSPETYRQGVDVICSSFRRSPLDTFDVRIKSLNYLNNIMAKMEARRANAQEAILLNHQGHVTECTADNILALRRGVLHYPSSHLGALEGITLEACLDCARMEGIETRASSLGMFDLYTADEVILTGTGAELVPVRQIDGRTIGSGKPGPIFTRLQARFQASLLEDRWFEGTA